MGNQYFKHKELLSPPIKRAAYSDRTAWLMAEMSKLAYSIFEDNDTELKTALAEAGFELVQYFDYKDTQVFLAKRDEDKMAVLSFRGTQKEKLQDITTDLNAKFYHDEKGVKIHDGFYKAFKSVEDRIKNAVDNLKDFSLYVTGHSLGGALALIATRALNFDNLAACYTFGSPKVGNEEFDDDIKPPIYRIVNAYDIVPVFPPTYILKLLYSLPRLPQKLRNFIKQLLGYDHHGDMRYLSPCDDNFEGLKVIANYNEFLRLLRLLGHKLAGLLAHKKESVKDHAINIYCEKLAQWALKRRNIK